MQGAEPAGGLGPLLFVELGVQDVQPLFEAE
jgi:hypothetical protein